MGIDTGIITGFLVIAIIVVSLIALQKQYLIYKLALIPYRIYTQKEYYRFITHMFVHAGILHMLINVFVLYSFGSYVEKTFVFLAMDRWVGRLNYLLLFLLSGIMSSLSSYYKHRHDPAYVSVGASGAVSAIVFSAILINPWNMVLVFFIPMPAIAMGILYLVYSIWMSRRAVDNINHEAHLWGAIFGLIYTSITYPELVKHFIRLLTNPPF
ncbi:MAG: rhomboid family intramembrane serine protease [Chlorobi bacterium]|nr:rhomboid family intramembrane serine protease [Chlorobiota bacterium]